MGRVRCNLARLSPAGRCRLLVTTRTGWFPYSNLYSFFCLFPVAVERIDDAVVVKQGSTTMSHSAVSPLKSSDPPISLSLVVLYPSTARGGEGKVRTTSMMGDWLEFSCKPFISMLSMRICIVAVGLVWSLGQGADGNPLLSPPTVLCARVEYEYLGQDQFRSD